MNTIEPEGSKENPPTDNSQIRQIHDLDEIDSLGNSEKVRERTKRVLNYATEVGYAVFEVRTGSGRWLIVAHNDKSVEANMGVIKSFDDLQATKELWQIWGACTTLHLEAKSAKVTDGLMRARYTASDRERIKESIYPQGSGGIGHYIGFKDTPKETIYVDLTAKVNLFTPTISDTESAFNGLVVIEPRDSTIAINKLYAARWVKD